MRAKYKGIRLNEKAYNHIKQKQKQLTKKSGVVVTFSDIIMKYVR